MFHFFKLKTIIEIKYRARSNFVLEHLLIVLWVVVDLLSYFSFQSMFNKGCGMCYPDCEMVHIKDSLLIIKKSSPCNGTVRFFSHCLSYPLSYALCYKIKHFLPSFPNYIIWNRNYIINAIIFNILLVYFLCIYHWSFQYFVGVRCSSEVRTFAHSVMGHWIDPTWATMDRYGLSCVWDDTYKRTSDVRLWNFASVSVSVSVWTKRVEFRFCFRFLLALKLNVE